MYSMTAIPQSGVAARGQLGILTGTVALLILTSPTVGAQARTVAGGVGSQVRPAAAQLSTGTLLLTFERLLTAHRRRVYVQRRRPGRGWSWARAVPMAKGDFTQRDPTLVVRKKDEVLVYVQVGDLRRRRAAVRAYRSGGDSLKWKDAGRLKLRLATTTAGAKATAKLVLTQPYAAGDRAGGVLLTVTRRFAGKANGCHLARSSNGLHFGPLRRIGVGHRCRVVAMAPNQLVLTYQTRARRRLPWRAYFQHSADGGKTWAKARPVSALRATSEVHTLVEPGSTLRFVFMVTLGRGSAIQSTTWLRTRVTERRLSRPSGRRNITPFALYAPSQSRVYFAREVRPLDFDILSLPLGPRRPPKTTTKQRKTPP
jgi:hypothetical protein